MEPLTMLGLGSSILGGLGLFGSGGKPYKKAAQEASKYYDIARGYQQPYYQHGLDQYERLNAAQNMLNDPTRLQNQWANAYETSPYAQRMLQTNTGQGLDAASAMGLLGSSGALQNIQTGAGDIVSRDRQQYLNDLMQKYLSGIGLGSQMYGIGAETGRNLGQQAMTQGENLAQLKYGQESVPNSIFGSLLRGGLGILGM
jgi:hypothetical protein